VNVESKEGEPQIFFDIKIDFIIFFVV